MAPITIKVLKDGPLVISGDDVQNVAIVDASGNPLPPRGTKVSLCRCGGSSNKPFCDGTHSKIGFKGAEQAVREFDQQPKTGQ
jgi:3-phenylpropionate/trans-cinnamate dioxygenase ferredoxin subunit